jgi:hypothetical protein
MTELIKLVYETAPVKSIAAHCDGRLSKENDRIEIDAPKCARGNLRVIVSEGDSDSIILLSFEKARQFFNAGLAFMATQDGKTLAGALTLEGDEFGALERALKGAGACSDYDSDMRRSLLKRLEALQKPQGS